MFEWIEIPAGQVTLTTPEGWGLGYIPPGESRTFPVERFAIAKYPVTNAQFAPFVQAEGYVDKRWWPEPDWWVTYRSSVRDEQHLPPPLEPRYWRDPKFNQPDHPVVGISWYEAIAFCLWLQHTTHEPIMLPTEQQWQRAAQGDDGRKYPWGDRWDGTRCNSIWRRGDDRGITPVTAYEGKGDSPFGVVDMAGNAWEWCATNYVTGDIVPKGGQSRVMRGGSWTSYQHAMQVNYRPAELVYKGYYFHGLRLSKPL